MAQMTKVHVREPELAWSISVKIAHPSLFSRLLGGDRQAHADAARMATDFAQLAPDMATMLGSVVQIHRWEAYGWKLPDEAKPDDPEQLRLGSRGGAQRVFRWLFEKVDLTVTI